MWIHIASIDEISETCGVAKEVDGQQVALFRLGEQVFATSNVCTHQYALLTEGYIEGEYVFCPMHQGCFHIPSGAAQEPPVSKPIQTFPVKVEQDKVFIDLNTIAESSNGTNNG